MVVLAVSVLSKSGKVLVSRQFFVDISRIRIERILGAFPNLVCQGKQHTSFEYEDVRYVYHPMGGFYLLLVTDKQSNILLDLETLKLLSKLVVEYSPSLDEEGLVSAFELIFAFDEVITLGQNENVTFTDIKEYCKMVSPNENLHKLKMKNMIKTAKDVMKRRASEIDKAKIDKNTAEKGGSVSLQSTCPARVESKFSDLSISATGGGLSTDTTRLSESKGCPPEFVTAPLKGGMQLGKTNKTNKFLESLRAEGEVILEEVLLNPCQYKSVALPSDPIILTVEEKLNVSLKRNGGMSNFDVQGALWLKILNEKDGLLLIQVKTPEDPGIHFRTHPNINKELFTKLNVLGLKDPDRPFPTDRDSVAGICLLKWTMQSVDEVMVPLTINCWASSLRNETFVSLEYEASPMTDLQKVVISIPLPALREAPNVRRVDGELRYNSQNSILEWSISLIDKSNRSGSMEFVVPPADSSVFFPISASFTATRTFSDLKVVDILSLHGGLSQTFSQSTQLITGRYEVV